MEVIKLDRVFRYDKKDLSDIVPTMSPEEILEHYSNTYPELINAKANYVGVENDKMVYEFKTNIGSKG
jgi:PRTRC genetic system protein C